MSSTVVQTTAYPQQNYPPQQNQGPNQSIQYTAQQGAPLQQNAAPYPPTSYPPQPGTTVIQVPATTTSNTTNNGSGSPKYNKKAGVVTGILQLIVAGTLVVLGIIIISLSPAVYVGWNIWGSLCFYMVSGILGIVSKNQNKCVIVAYMVMSIISAVSAGGQMIFDSTTASIYSYYANGALECGFNNNIYHYDYNDFTAFCKHAQALNALFAISALIGFAEIVIAIVASAYCCCGVCGSTTPSQTTVVTLTTQPAPGTTYPVSTYPAYPPQGQPAQPPPSYAYVPPPQPQSQQGQYAEAYEEKK